MGVELRDTRAFRGRSLLLPPHVHAVVDPDGLDRLHGRLHGGTRGHRPLSCSERPHRGPPVLQGRLSPTDFAVGASTSGSRRSTGSGSCATPRLSTPWSPICTHLGCTPQLAGRREQVQVPLPRQRLLHGPAINFEGPAPRPLERCAIVARRRRPDRRRQEREVPGGAGPVERARSFFRLTGVLSPRGRVRSQSSP